MAWRTVRELPGPAPERSAAVARRLARSADVSYVQVRGGKHAMLRRHATFDALAADFTVASLRRSDTELAVRPQDWRQV